MGANGHGRVRFGFYELDFRSGKLFRNGCPVKIQPQPLRVLSILLERPGEIVSREQLRARVWGESTFVEFDQGLNYSIRQIRLALHEAASQPRYIETLPKQGYRFIADVFVPPNGVETHGLSGDAAAEEPIVTERAADRANKSALEAATAGLKGEPAGGYVKGSNWVVTAVVCAALATISIAAYPFFRAHPAVITYRQLTDFTDSAMAPTLSPDGHLVAFIRGNSDFLTADQVYVKMLPNGEAKRLTDDPRLKYNLAFSPDGSQIAYTVLDRGSWATYTVPVLGGGPKLLLNNAAGLTWLDGQQLLFSEIRSGVHMGIVTGTVARDDFRVLYFPSHERAMAHYSYASPDRKSALVVEMNGNGRGEWGPCRLISLDGRFATRSIGPEGACTSAGWSPDGTWMYFTADVNGHSHLWRQRFPTAYAMLGWAASVPEQLTFGPTEEKGVSIEQDGRSLITSMGAQQSALWFHDAGGERSLSSEGEVIADISPPSFDVDGKVLYYLLRRQSAGSGAQLWRMRVDSGESELVLPGVSMHSYDVSPTGKQVVYSTTMPGGKSALWLAPLDRSAPAKQIGGSGETSPHFGPRGQVLFQAAEANVNYLEQMNADGSGRSRVVPYPILDIQGISPGRRWVMATAPVSDGKRVAPVAIPVDGGTPRIVCASFCVPTWSSNGKFLFVPVEASSRKSLGRSLAIPVGPGESLPELPPGGIAPGAEPSAVPGSQSVDRAELVPGKDPSHYAYVKTTVHRNLYRISLP